MSVVLEQAWKLQSAGRTAQAEALYRALLRNRPNEAAAHHGLGVLLHRTGRLDEAMPHYNVALAAKLRYPHPRTHLAYLRLAQGELDAALAEFQAAHAASPQDIEALDGLGAALSAVGRCTEAVPVLKTLLAHTPDDPDVMLDLANALDVSGQMDEAVGFYRKVLELAPDRADAWYSFGNCRIRQQKMDEAIACFRRALTLRPDYPQAEENLGMVLCRQGAIAESLAVFAALGARGIPDGWSPQKRTHDAEQAEYLAANPPAGSGARVAGPAINPANAAPIQDAWQKADPKIVVIDDLLSPAALDGLRDYMLGAPIWRLPYPSGYLGAMPKHGLSAPLIGQIANELSATFPAIFAGHALNYFWAFKYESRLPGIAIHADRAAVNVNFWLTPDSANRDPASGGLKVWNAAAPADWDFNAYNSGGQAIRDFLACENAKSITIPYRANRAVIFDSDLFHETDTIDFEEGYENRRINMTMLYGYRTADDHG